MSKIVYKHAHKPFHSLKVGQLFTNGGVPYIKISDSSVLIEKDSDIDIRRYEKYEEDGTVCMMPVNAVSLYTGKTYTLEAFDDCVLDVTVTIGG